jgi:predicted amidohydrolase YtcJ
VTRTGRLLVAAGIHTLADGQDGAARAVLVEGERIRWCGTDPAAAPAHERAVDLGGAWITPAFVDAHVHGTATGLLAEGVDLFGVGSGAALLAAVRAHAARTPSGQPILGAGWDDFAWPEGAPPTASELAAAAPGRPIHLARVDAHSCLVDPATLARLPLERLDGVDRDADGQPTGLVREAAAGAALGVVREALTGEQLARARRATCRQAAALGIGALHEMGHPGMYGLADAEAWAAGSWPVDVAVWWAELDAGRCAARGLRPGGDLFLDGSIGSRTAAVGQPFRDGGGTGELFHDAAAVAAFFTTCTERGLGAGVHAIGDRAIDQAVAALDAAAAAQGVNAVRRCRHRIEHLELARPEHLARLGRLGVVASIQPVFDAWWGGPDGLYAARFGPELAARTNPLAWCADAGMALAFGSDSTVTPLDPWGAVHAAVEHRGGLGVDRRTALRAHTAGGRYAAGQDDVGVVAPGMRADLAVWEHDPLVADVAGGSRCLATLVRGVPVHGDLPGAR